MHICDCNSRPPTTRGRERKGMEKEKGRDYLDPQLNFHGCASVGALGLQVISLEGPQYTLVWSSLGFSHQPDQFRWQDQEITLLCVNICCSGCLFPGISSCIHEVDASMLNSSFRWLAQWLSNDVIITPVGILLSFATTIVLRTV